MSSPMEYWVGKGRLIFDCKTNKLKYIGTSRAVARQAASSVEALKRIRTVQMIGSLT
jgi:hypothetical protein